MMGKVIYLTGAPASGKSSTTRLLLQKCSGLQVWEYGARLTDHIKSRSGGIIDQSDLRSQSAATVTPEDVRCVDDALLDFVASNRLRANVLIDSHAVTKEAWGFRVIPYSFERFSKLAPDEIWVLFTGPDIAIERISKDAGGRPTIDLEQARMHTELQASVAATYAMSLGIPLYLFDSSGCQEKLSDCLRERLA